MTLLKKTLIAASAGVLIAPVVALAAPTVSDAVGTNLEEVMNNLANAGYEVREIEAENDELEAVVLTDGQLLELEISPETGMILSVELEEDDDEDDDDEDMGN
ncbi:MAG: PepSY domain-containing protein [Pseudomonadota bacterium]